MLSDKQRWDRKYSGRKADPKINADALLLRYITQMPAHGLALDVAAGAGDNACLLAQAGYQSFAVDISFQGLKLCRAKAQSNDLVVNTFVADVSKFPLPAARFDVVVVMHFLDRDALPRFRSCLRPNGWMVYKTFNQRYLQSKPGFPRAYVLREGELQDIFADWISVETNDHPDNPGSTSFWVGRRPPQADPARVDPPAGAGG